MQMLVIWMYRILSVRLNILLLACNQISILKRNCGFTHGQALFDVDFCEIGACHVTSFCAVPCQVISYHDRCRSSQWVVPMSQYHQTSKADSLVNREARGRVRASNGERARESERWRTSAGERLRASDQTTASERGRVNDGE